MFQKTTLPSERWTNQMTTTAMWPDGAPSNHTPWPGCDNWIEFGPLLPKPVYQFEATVVNRVLLRQPTRKDEPQTCGSGC